MPESTCECGCGERPKPGNRYLHNHHWRGKHRDQRPSPESNAKRSATQRRYEPDAVCVIEGCDAPRKARDYCNKHYTRIMRYGDPDALNYRRGPSIIRGSCRIEGCEKPSMRSRTNLCNMHLTRLLRTGTTDKLVQRHAELTYRGAHSRIQLDRGSAKAYACADCGGAAAHWSFSWRRVPPDGWMWGPGHRSMLAYTCSPADYDPRCVRCARRYDSDFAMCGWQRLPHH